MGKTLPVVKDKVMSGISVGNSNTILSLYFRFSLMITGSIWYKQHVQLTAQCYK